MAGAYIHPTALVETDRIGAGTRVWAFAHLMAGSRIGANGNVGDHAFVESGAVIGDNVTLKNNVCVWAGVMIEDDVFVGPNVSFTNDRHPRSPRMAAACHRYATTDGWLENTVVEQGASIGAAAVILPGVRIGRYAMIAAGAIVTGDVEPYALMVGAPARPIGSVCRCGERLDGCSRTTVCPACGETPELRYNDLPFVIDQR